MQNFYFLFNNLLVRLERVNPLLRPHQACFPLLVLTHQYPVVFITLSLLLMCLLGSAVWDKAENVFGAILNWERHKVGVLKSWLKKWGNYLKLKKYFYLI